jgi:hypothetical protein
MLSKLVTRQVINHGLQLTKRAASAAAQQQLVGNRNPDIKHQKVSFQLFKIIVEKNNNFFFCSFLLIMNLLMQQVEIHLKFLIQQLVMLLLKLLMLPK